MIDLVQTRQEAGTTMDAIVAEISRHSSTIDAFHRVFYASPHTHGMTYFEGVPILKNPLDLWVLQEIMWDLKPTFVLETGTAFGGSALYMAKTMDRIGGKGQVLSVDLSPADRLPRHPRVAYLAGYSSVDPGIVGAVKAAASIHERIMVVLDSDHSMEHVTRELETYASIVTPGQFLVVEDTNINGRPVPINWKGGPGPGPAVDEWLPKHDEFERAPMAERYMVTFHTWLRRRQ